METGERSGPLSYSVDTPDVEVSAERPIFVASLVALGISPLLFAAGWYLLGVVADNDLVNHSIEILIVAITIAVAVRLARSTYRRRMYIAGTATAVVALLCAFVVGSLLSSTRPTFPRLRSVLSSAQLPTGWRYLGVEQASGTRLGSSGWPRVTRTYEVAAGTAKPIRAAVDSLINRGWKPTDRSVDLDLINQVRKHGVYLTVAESNAAGEVRISASGTSFGA